MTSRRSGFASQSRGTFEEEHSVIVCGLVNHLEGGLALEDESDRRALCFGSKLLQVLRHAKLLSGRVCITERSFALLFATIASQTGWLGDQDAFSIVRSGVFLASIQVVECQRQEWDDSRLLASTVDERILEGVSPGLHGSKTAGSCTDRTMESLCKPASTSSPSLVVLIGIEVCCSHSRDDQINGLAPNFANICVPNDLASWSTLGANSTQIVRLDAILLHRDG